ncbi:hypothetical protein LTR84_005286 [Exophiala bonariae]|uniref:Uncharacterized protein n=1 Tax=Exophiala bonariae TaxID=1690606 RepID=A0AAV9NS22_9EURO|nr:hypothetical protein LTR84_005286 [Exophiala bonariae]
MRRDAAGCRAIAPGCFDLAAGIRSMINLVRDRVRIPLMLRHLGGEALIEVGQERVKYMLDMRNNEIAITTSRGPDDVGSDGAAGETGMDGEPRDDKGDHDHESDDEDDVDDDGLYG